MTGSGLLSNCLQCFDSNEPEIISLLPFSYLKLLNDLLVILTSLGTECDEH